MNEPQYLLDVALKRDKVESFDHYPFAIPAVRELDSIDLATPVTFLIGENGSGKSTLIEAIAVALGFNAEGGTKNFNFDTRKSHSVLHEYIRLGRSHRRPKDGFFLRAESFFNVATNIEQLDGAPSFGPPVIASYGGQSLHEQSHGESFLALLVNRFGGNGLYLLDEPEAALSPSRQLAVLSRIDQLVKEDSQFVIATHSPILMAYPGARIYQFDSLGISEIDYEDTEHFVVTKAFLSNPERMFSELFEDE